MNEAREQGYPQYLKKLEKNEDAMARAALAYKKSRNRAQILDPESTPAYKKDIQRREKQAADFDKNRAKFSSEQQKRSGTKSDLSDTIEYGLSENRPRYDYKKRPFYGGPGLIKAKGGNGSSSSGGGGGDSGDDFPAPAPDGDPGFEPPPPPPPPSGDFNDGAEDDIPPPPPPPPPPSGDF